MPCGIFLPFHKSESTKRESKSALVDLVGVEFTRPRTVHPKILMCSYYVNIGNTLWHMHHSHDKF
eukprot:1413289-Pleurochrysis_carterae.AAC.1